MTQKLVKLTGKFLIMTQIVLLQINTSNKTKYLGVQKKLNDLSREVKLISTKRLIKNLINGYSIVNVLRILQENMYHKIILCFSHILNI